MQKQVSLHECLYRDPCWIAVLRAIGYSGCVYRQLHETLAEAVKEFGQQRVDAAVVNLCTYEGQFRVNPPPLTQVQLRAEARKLAWSLLGPPPERPWHDLWKRPEPLPAPWEMEPDGSPKKKPQAEEPAALKPKRTRKKNVS
jgi:hypothetical protein